MLKDTILYYNKKAIKDYKTLFKYEAGLVLQGKEVKIFVSKRLSFINSYVRVSENEVFIHNVLATLMSGHTMSIKLLLHKKEIKNVIECIRLKRLLCLPIKVYFNKNNIVKSEIHVLQHMKAPEKKKILIEKQNKRNLERELKHML